MQPPQQEVTEVCRRCCTAETGGTSATEELRELRTQCEELKTDMKVQCLQPFNGVLLYAMAIGRWFQRVWNASIFSLVHNLTGARREAQHAMRGR